MDGESVGSGVFKTEIGRKPDRPEAENSSSTSSNSDKAFMSIDLPHCCAPTQAMDMVDAVLVVMLVLIHDLELLRFYILS
jgi:hypothetical protein